MDVIFWLDRPPFACKGVLDAFSDFWENGKVYYACIQNVSGIQTVTNANFAEDSKAKVIIFENSNLNPLDFAEQHLSAIHIFNGYKSLTKEILLFIKKKDNNAKVILWGEEPRISKKYRYIPHFVRFITKKEYLQFSRLSDAFLVIGKQGVRDYSKLGWPKEKLFPFYYCSVDCSKTNEQIKRHDPIKFLYLGRFDYKDKGVDTIFKALKIIKNRNFTFTFAGGYGAKTDEIKKNIMHDARTLLDSPKPINDCYDYFQNYDIYVSPAKADSWSGPLSTALLSGIPVIASDRCGNDFLIKDGYNGFVFKAGNNRKLAYYMKNFILGKYDIESMKINAQKSSACIKPRVLAEYLDSIIKYLYLNSNKKPILIGDCKND